MKMRLFQPDSITRTDRNKRIYAFYELWYTIADFVAALSFLAGSFLFFSEATQTAGTWCFVVGSLFFLLKPSLRFAREIVYLSLGDTDTLALRAGLTEREQAKRELKE